MSRKDGFTAKGSFRKAEFVIENDDLAFGRRNQVHEYPLRDKPMVEDMGRSKREFTIKVFVIGADYKAKRDALINAIEKPGPGPLVHPYFGTMSVSIISARKSESTNAGGKAEFTLTCVEVGNLAIVVQATDTVAAVAQAVEKTLADSIKDFGDNFSVIGQAADFVQGVVDDVANVMAAVEDVVGDVVGDITSLINSPLDMASLITGSINSIGNTLKTPLSALSVYQGLFNAGSTSATVPTNTSSRQTQANNVQALHLLVQRAAVAEAARMSSQIDFAARDDALAAMDKVLDAIDAQIEATNNVTGEPITDAVYQALIDMRTAVANDLRSRGAKLAQLTAYTPETTLPALVIAHQVYGDASRDEEIITRNNIRHPGFVPGGSPLEVLTTDGLVSRSAGRTGVTTSV